MDDPNKQPEVTPTPAPVQEVAKDPVENLRMDTIRAKANCRKCHGTGREGYINGNLNEPLVCQCVIKIYRAAEALKKAQAPVTIPVGPVNDEKTPVVEALPVDTTIVAPIDVPK